MGTIYILLVLFVSRVMLGAALKRPSCSARTRCSLVSRNLGYYTYVRDGGSLKPHETVWDKMAKKFQSPPNPGTLILVRHGETEWNQKRLFTGWVDVDLSDRGIREIEHASRLLLERGYTVDITYTSVLRRAVRSSWIMLNEIDQIYGPVIKSWRLNERMYGALEGHSKPGLASMYGEELVQLWREGLSERPPAMTADHPYWHGHERKYATLDPALIPLTESLEDTIARTAPLWESHIKPDLVAGRNVMIVAHRNSLRGILKILDGISTTDIQQVSVPNGIPLVYKFDEHMQPIKQKNCVAPLSGIWLGKKGLLRAALDQEAELAKHIEGYSYSPTGNKYDTKAFYYHSSAFSNQMKSKYSRHDPQDSDWLLSNNHNHHLHNTHHSPAHSAAAVPHTPAPIDDLSVHNANILEPAYSGADAHLVRKLILVEQERKMFDLIDQGGRANISSVLSPSMEDFEFSTDPNIFVDPLVLQIPPHEYARTRREQLHRSSRNTGSRRAVQGTMTDDGFHPVDEKKLNQARYFEDPAPTPPLASTTTAAGPVSAASPLVRNGKSLLRQRPLLVIIRHGKTEHNKLGLFTGWDDAALATEGRKEARYAGKLLRRHGVKFDVVYTSWLSRAIETAWLVMNELDALWLPINKTWRLNERMYGALTGLSKKMIKQIYGEAQFKRWRRGYHEPPPPISSFSSSYPGNDSRYVKYVRDVPISWFETAIRSLAHGRLEMHRDLPKTESLKDCMERTIPHFMQEIQPDSLDLGKNVLIASSENAIRGLLMHLCQIPDSRIHSVEIPTGLPLVYDPHLRKIRLLQELVPAHHPHQRSPEGEGTLLAGRALLQKYHFGDSPELLFDLDQLDVPLEDLLQHQGTSSSSTTGSGSSTDSSSQSPTGSTSTDSAQTAPGTTGSASS